MMPSKICTTILFLVSCLLISDVVCGQFPYPKLKLTHFTVADGLSSNGVNCITQDHNGFMWIGTDDGLNRFDGGDFVIYKKVLNDTNSLPSNQIMSIVEDSMHRIWIGTMEGLCYIDTRTSQVHRQPVNGNIGHLISDLILEGKKYLWIGSLEHVYCLNLENFSIAAIRLSSGAEYPWQPRASCLLMDNKKGVLYVGGWDGVYKVNTTDHHVQYILPSAATILSLHYTDKEHLHICTWGNGTIRFNTTNNRVENHIVFSKAEEDASNQEIMTDMVLDLSPDGKPIYWITGAKGIMITDPRFDQILKTYDFETGNTGTGFLYIDGLLKDRDGNLWFWSDIGFAKLERAQQSFSLHDLSSMGISTDIGWILAVPGFKDHYLISVYPGGILWYDADKQVIVRQYLPRTTNEGFTVIHSFMRDSHQRFWVGSGRGGICQLDLNQSSLVYFPDPKNNSSWPYNAVHQMEEDNGQIWFASKAGLGRFDPDQHAYEYFYHYDTSKHSTLGDHRLLSIQIDSRHRIWCGSHADGIFIFYPEKKLFEKISIEYPEENVMKNIRGPKMAEDSSGNIWLASEYGLFVFNEKQNIFKPVLNGKLPGAISEIVAGHDGNLWLSSGSRLFHYNHAANTIRNYSTPQGLEKEDATSIGSISPHQMYIGYPGKFIFFDPADLKSKANDHPLRLVGFHVLGTDSLSNITMIDETAHLRYTQNDVRFDFRLLDFGDPKNTEYAFMLDGLDDKWNFSGNSNFAVYTNIHEGNYTLKVKAANADGAWTEPTALAHFSIATPYYRSLIFRIGILLLCATVVLLIYYNRQRERRRIARVRTKISSDLHDDIGSTLTSIRLYSELAKRNPANSSDGINVILDKIDENAGDMLRSMSDIVWVINPKHDTFQSLRERMNDFAANILSPKEIQYSFNNDGAIDKIKLPMEVRKNIFLIFKEAINNATKYSGCEHVQIIFSLEEKILFMKVSDDGQGFDVQLIQRGNGLNNMHRRAEELKGDITIHSEPGTGTSIELRIPA